MARRILVSFGITLVGFAITVGWAIYVQKRAAEDNLELSRGYVPLALRLGQLRATQVTLSTLVDGIPDERNPASTRVLLGTLVSARRAKFGETRSAVDHLGAHGAATRRLADDLSTRLEAIEELLADDRTLFERLFFAIASADKDSINAVLVSLGALEHDADSRLRALAEQLSSAMDAFAVAAHTRERRAIWALGGLSLLTLLVGAGVSLHTRRLLAPLAQVSARAQAVARGDLTQRAVPAASDEISELAASFERMVGGLAEAQAAALSNERFAAIGKMAAHVTHEIRNPLSSIGLNLELLEEELGLTAGEAGEAKALLGAIQREVGRLERLSEEYLRVARLPSPRLELGDVAVVVSETVSFVRAEIEQAGCRVVLEVEPSLPQAFVEEAQLRQALVNLLRNAREAMPEGGLIEVRVARHDDGVAIVVEDRGGGIAEPIRSQVFEPFFSTKGAGTGLGLAVTKHIVEAHGGTVRCEAREGGGTRFRMVLPTS
ncbi:MAG: ATP-binding protein [Myxococcales bacterium]